MCLALAIAHPDKLDEQLTRLQFLEWVEYYKRKPFGRWIDTEMMAGLSARFSGQSLNECLPKVEELVDLESGEIDVDLIPGCGEAEQWLKQIYGKG